MKFPSNANIVDALAKPVVWIAKAFLEMNDIIKLLIGAIAVLTAGLLLLAGSMALVIAKIPFMVMGWHQVTAAMTGTALGVKALNVAMIGLKTGGIAVGIIGLVAIAKAAWDYLSVLKEVNEQEKTNSLTITQNTSRAIKLFGDLKKGMGEVTGATKEQILEACTRTNRTYE